MVKELSELVGKRMLLTIIVCDRNGEVKERSQYHGTVEDSGGEPVLQSQNTEDRIPIPPIYDQIEKIDPGQQLEMEESGEKISGIDYTLTCVKSPP